MIDKKEISNGVKKTIENLAKAFIGESQARNRYTMYAKVAQKEGYEQIAAVFLETAEQEREHAKWAFNMLRQAAEKSGENIADLKVDADVPAEIGTTQENLKAAIGGETYEHTSMYPGFADDAEKDGLGEMAARIRAIARAEQHHKERYEKLLKQLEGGTIFKKDKEISWVCRKCGYVHVGTEAPVACPSCAHPQSYYQVLCEEY